MATRFSSFSLATYTATTGSLGYAAFATEDASPPLLSVPHATTSTSSKGVAVGSPYHGGADSSRGTGASYKTVRLSGVSFRHGVKGGEAALIGRLLGASEVGRNTSFISSPSSALPSPSLTVDASKLSAASIAAPRKYDQLWDHLHSTAFQGSPSGDSMRVRVRRNP